MSTNLREYIKPLVKELEVRGIKHSLNLEGKHAKLQFVLQGKHLSLTIPKTSSDRRGCKNDVARLKRWLGPAPFASQSTKTEEPKVEPKPQVAHVRFGIHADGRLAATLPLEELEKVSAGPLRAMITRSSEGRVIINFVPVGGVKGTVTDVGTVSFVWSRSKVPFTYGKRRIHGRSVSQLLGRFITPESLVLDQQLPEAILQLNKPQEPRLPFDKVVPPAKKPARSNVDLPNDILDEGKAIREMFNDWVTRATQKGCSVSAKIEGTTLRVFASKPVEL